MSNEIGVINYGSGNYRSVCNALDFLNIARLDITCAHDFSKVDHILLPGVGSYSDCMKRITALGITEALKDELKNKGKLYLGICVGMQILTNFGTEHGNTPGLGIIAGSTNAIKPNPGIRIPHIGWSEVSIQKDSAIFRGISNGSSFYFVHGFHVVVEDTNVMTGSVMHGEEICASLENDNIYGVQFHPEKSQKNGLQLLKNFSELASEVKR